MLLYKIIIWRFSDSGTTLLNVICIPQISCGFAAFFSPANCIAQEPLESTAEDIILLQSFGLKKASTAVSLCFVELSEKK